MQALWLEHQQLNYYPNLPPPKPLAGEALVRVLVAGICTTDLELLKGYYPFNGILGHEFVGEIVEATAAPQRVGQRVVGEINIACGHCRYCQRGWPTHCEQRATLGIANRNGAFAEYLGLPLNNLIPVPATVSNEAAVFTEPLAAALQIQQQMSIRPTDQVLVIGAGRLGQLIAQTLTLTGCHLQVVARYPKQRQLLATRQIPWLAENQVTDNRFDLVVEATGSSSGFTLAQQAVRPRGTIILKSTYAGSEIPVNFSSLVVAEITVIGCRCGPFAPALRLLEQHLVEPTILIEDRFPLAEGIRAFECAKQAGALKILLV